MMLMMKDDLMMLVKGGWNDADDEGYNSANGEGGWNGVNEDITVLLNWASIRFEKRPVTRMYREISVFWDRREAQVMMLMKRGVARHKTECVWGGIKKVDLSSDLPILS